MREQRLIFGEDAELYDKARPTYPPDIIDDVVALAGGAGGRALDIGCGTGKATVLLAARGLEGLGIEPDPAMAAVARRNLRPFPRWRVAVADFEDFAAGGGQRDAFDLLSCAQAWHWLAPEVRFGHAHALLRPGGWLALWWNRTADDRSPLRRDVDQVYREVCPTASPHGLLTAGRPPVGSVPGDVAFGAPIERSYDWVRRYSTTEWTDLVQTHSDHRLLPPDRLAVLLRRLTEVIDGHGGYYDHPYRCWLWASARR